MNIRSHRTLLGLVPALATAAALLASPGAQAEDMNVRIYNRSNIDLVSIYVSPTYRGNYGTHDVLGSGMIHAGYNRRVDFDVADAEGQCVLDVKAVGARGTWKRRINVCTATNWNLYGSEDDL